MLKKNKLLIYTDASFKDGFGGWAALIIYNHKRTLITGKIPKFIPDSGTCEFYAVLKAIEYARDNFSDINKISINTDHNGIVDCFNRYFKTDEILGKPLNKSIKKKILYMARNMKVKLFFNHIKGHQQLKRPKLQNMINELRQANDLNLLISKIKLKKMKSRLDYKELKRAGSTKSSILNNIVDVHSRRMRRQAERAAIGKINTGLLCQ